MPATPYPATRALPRRILISTLIVTLLALAAMTGLVCWLTAQTNRQEADNATHLLDTIVQARIAQIHTMLEDYAWYDFAHELVADGDGDAIYRHLGSAVGEDALVSQMALTSADGTPLHVFRAGAGARSDTAWLDGAGLAPLIARLPAADVDSYPIVSGHTVAEGAVHHVALGRVQPYAFAGLDPAALPLMALSQTLDAAFLDALRRQAMLEDLTLSTRPPGDAAAGNSLPLTDAAGDTVAWLIWTPRRPGDALRARALPVLLAIAALLLAGSVLVAHVSGRQALSLQRERDRARRDPLTGLLNRRGLAEAMAHLTANPARRRDTGLSVLYLDLAGFKRLNDSAGHRTGDIALQKTAQRLRTVLREGDILARTGGDEFAILLPDGADPAQIRARVDAACAAPVTINGVAWLVRPDIGETTGAPGQPWQMLMARADADMYAKKHARRARTGRAPLTA